MKFFYAVLLSACSVCLLPLVGCGSFSSGAGLSSSAVSTPAVHALGSIQGSVYGGHAPLVGAHVYVLEATASSAGYASEATSLLSASYSSSAHPTVPNTSDPGVPTSWYYEFTDYTGQFNISGDYACTEGDPVYLYAYGGSPTTSGTNNVYQFNQVNVSNITGSGESATATYTLTLTTTESFTVGEQVTFTNVQGDFAGGNGTVATVTSTNLTSTTFSVVEPDPNGEYSGNYATTGTVTAVPGFNPAVVNMAMLGVCPSSGNFSTGGTLPSGATLSPISYVYTNEVSTVALAYAMSGFGTDGLHIGASATNATGLQNAALNAGNLYDIQGKYISTVFNGEGHIANPTTFAGSNNGTVPQAELDTLGNILAACVDSNNTQSTTSPQCTQLLLSASSTGGLPPGYNASTYANNGTTLPSCTATSGIGTAAANTAQAAFNIAHFPETPCVTALYTLSTGSVPFTPNLTSTGAGQPNDFTVGITYNNVTAPTGVAIDAGGNAYVPNIVSTTASTITKLSPLGSVVATSPSLGAYADSLAIDQSGNVWVTVPGSNIGNQINPVNNQNGNGVLYMLNSGLTTATAMNSTVGGPTSVAIDTNNNVFMAEYSFFANTNNYAVAEYSGGTLSQISVANSQSPESISLNSIGGTEYLWVEYNANAFYILKSTGAETGTGTNYSTNFNLALDSNGNGWFGAEGQTNAWKTTSAGTATAYGKGTGNNGQNDYVAGLWQPTWTAVDGANNIFFVNNNGTTSSISELNNSGFALSCPTCLSGSNNVYGYQKGKVGALASLTPNGHTLYVGFTAIDGSGDLWVPNYTANTLLEVIGVATPAVTPLSSEKPGVAP